MSRISDSQPLIWRFIRQSGQFTIADIQEQLNLPYGVVQRYVCSLKKSGYLAAVKEKYRYGERFLFTLIKNSPGAPKNSLRMKEKIVCSRDRMWQVMRILRGFSVRDICTCAEVSESYARQYIHLLKKNGYLRVTSNYKRGVAGSYTYYSLGWNTGPSAPVIRKNQLVDINLGNNIGA